MEEVVDNLEKKMKCADKKLDNLAITVDNIEKDILSDHGAQVEVNNLLKTVTDVKKDYQNLRQNILEVQDLQKQLSTSLQTQLQLLQLKCNLLREKLTVNVPNPPGEPKIIVTDYSVSPGKTFREGK